MRSLTPLSESSTCAASGDASGLGEAVASPSSGDSVRFSAVTTGWASGFVSLSSIGSGFAFASGTRSAEGMRGAPLSRVSSSGVS